MYTVGYSITVIRFLNNLKDFSKVVLIKSVFQAHIDISNQCMNLNNGDKQNIQLGKFLNKEIF